MSNNNDAKIKNKSLQKALKTLNCFIEKQPLGITEISEALGLYKSNVYDILSTLSAMGYVQQNPETGKYSLGFSCLRLGRAARESFGFNQLAASHIREISRETGEICSLTIPQDDKIFYLDVATPADNTFMQFYLNNTMESMHCTSCGKSMLAFMPQSYVDEYLTKPMEKKTVHTITDPDVMRAELEKIRLYGYAIDDEEHSIGLRCVAAPILNHASEPVAAISVSGPSPRFTDEKTEQFAKLLRRHAKELSSVFELSPV